MKDNWKISLRYDVSLSFVPGGERIVLNWPGGSLAYKKSSAGMRAVLKIMTEQISSYEDLHSVIWNKDGWLNFFDLASLLNEFARSGILGLTLAEKGKSFATAYPLSFDPVMLDRETNEDELLILSRFAYFRRIRNRLVVETPLAGGTLVIQDQRGMLVMQNMTTPRSINSLQNENSDLSPALLSEFITMLQFMNIIQISDDLDKTPDTKNETIRLWDFHDLLFHARSRVGRNIQPSGSTGRFWGKIEAPQRQKNALTHSPIDLYQPDIETLKRNDQPFTATLENRISWREFGHTPMNDGQLGEFLFRTARVRKTMTNDVMEITNRPYPGAGAIYELEIYCVVDRCNSIGPGLFHYDAFNHQLHKMSDSNEKTEALFSEAMANMGDLSRPHILFLYAARFQRIAWKYESIAYALLLKDVGVLMQTMSLVATAMDLASCILGNGNSDLFAQATGLDYCVENSVGEFALGTLP